MNKKVESALFVSIDGEYQQLFSSEQVIEKLQQENQQLKIEISARETVCNELQERINKASALLKEFYETGNIPLNNISKAYYELNGGSNESQR